MKVDRLQGRRNRGRPKRKCLDKVMMISKRRDCRLMKCTTVPCYMEAYVIRPIHRSHIKVGIR